MPCLVTIRSTNCAIHARVAKEIVTVTVTVTGTGTEHVHAGRLDLAGQDSVDAFAGAWAGPLHIPAGKAGVMATALTRTAEGWELQFATNHLGHFALATRLPGALAAAGGARIVAVSSVGHLNGHVDFDDLQFDRRPYDPWPTYGQSKTVHILLAVEAANRWAADGIMADALNPGRITETNLGRHIGDLAPASFEPGSTAVSWKSIEQGAATSVLLAGSPLVEGGTGRYFGDCQEAGPNRPGVRAWRRTPSAPVQPRGCGGSRRNSSGDRHNRRAGISGCGRS